ncbi:MAG: hypothetical protein GWP10_06350 [Nitrospiraceae bacterium]|nr:hypothetical protein [Nitrospiraceae bacterium]
MAAEEELMDYLRERKVAVAILSKIMGCGVPEVRQVLRLLSLHKDALEKTEIFLDANCSNEWTFEAFIEGVQVATMAEIENQITEDQWYRIDSIMLKDTDAENCCKVAAVTDAFVNEAEIFADMCRNGVTQAKIELLRDAGEVISDE